MTFTADNANANTKTNSRISLRRSRFFFLNHGETDWDRGGMLAGRINAPLNGRGLSQARHAGEMLRASGIRTICTSPQDRALMTAEIVAAQIHAPVVVIEGLKDCCFGSLDGTSAGDWFTGRGLEDWRHGVTPTGAETAESFGARAVSAMNAALERGGPILVVAHPAIYAAFHLATGLPTELPPDSLGLPICHEPPHQSRNPASRGWRAAPLAA